MEFNDAFLAEVGLAAMPAEQKKDFLEYVQRELEIRIGERISKGLTEAQLAEFDAITDKLEAAKWLEKNRPDYREIVTRTIQEIKEEIRANSDKLL
jgi:protein-tyrosine-phosphatase